MLIAVILLMICQVITVFGACLLLRQFVNAKQADIEARAEAAFRSWVEPREGSKQSKLADILEATGAVVGSAAARSLMATFNAGESHAARAANTAADLTQAQINPLAAILSAGKRGKGAAVARLAELIGPMLANPSNHNGEHAEYAGRRHRE